MKCVHGSVFDRCLRLDRNPQGFLPVEKPGLSVSSFRSGISNGADGIPAFSRRKVELYKGNNKSLNLMPVSLPLYVSLKRVKN